MTKIVGISGSLRRDSYNGMLLRAAVKHAPEGLTIEIGSIRGIPLYDGDEETAGGIPPTAALLKEMISKADGLLLVTPEYNHSIPGVFKNAIDWLSRPSADIARVFGGKPVAIMGATIGHGGTMLAQSAWLPVLHTLGTSPYFGAKLHVSAAAKVFGPAGEVTDEKVRGQLEAFMKGFAGFIAG